MTVGDPPPRAAGAGHCAACGTQLPPTFLACPGCGRLVHTLELKRLAALAETATTSGDPRAALQAWQSALDLLPPGTKQRQAVSENLAALTAQVDGAASGENTAVPTKARPSTAAVAGAAVAGAAAASNNQTRRGKWAAGLGGLALLLAKFKWALVFLLAKGKVLLIGLAQAKTLLSMLFALGVYSSTHGWKFAAGLVVSIYVHEMGHVAWLRHYGIAATAPMFIPGLGAFVRLKSHPATALQDARVGLAGPLWGTAAALIFLAGGILLGFPSWKATAHVGAWINLFNLLPVWQLDGGRAFVALTRKQRGWLAGLLWFLALVTRDGVIVALALTATVRATVGHQPARGEDSVMMHYGALAISLATLLMVH